MVNIAVVGCGVIGMTSAIAIQNRLKNANVTIYTKDVSPNTTSDIAAGLLEPYELGSNPNEKVTKWFKATFNYTFQLWKEGKAKEAGVSLVPLINVSEKPIYELPDWAESTMGFHILSKDYLEALSKYYNRRFFSGFSFVTFTWEGSTFLPYLQKEFIGNGGRIIMKEIQDFQELAGYDCIVNCTGLKAKELSVDFNLKPIRGQIARVKAPWQLFAFLTDTVYIIPNINSVILGGTKQIDSNLNVDENDKQYILRNCIECCPALESAEIIAHQVGLRPGRDKVRLEIEIKGSGTRIVHNYGHGGAGITVSIGCAQEAAELVVEALNETSFKSKL